ncbi:hypothetical protein ACA910_012688 [Epithemia clementina (nom. ined.)]
MIVSAATLIMLLGLAQATEFSTDSVVGRNIMQKAKTVRASKFVTRNLQDNNQNWAYGNLGSLTIRYIGCSTYNKYANGQNYKQQQYYQAQQYEGQDQQQGANGQQGEGENRDENQYWYYQNMAQNDGLDATNLVRFTICTGSECSGSCDGEYVLDMLEFMESYTEYKMDHDSFWCERVRERCTCNPNSSGGYSWKDCYTACYEQSPYGLSYQGCLEANNNGGENVFQIQQYLECSGIQFYNPSYAYKNGYNNYAYQYAQNANGNQNANSFWRNYYYLGLSCKNNADVVLKAFYDEECSYPASETEVQEAMGSYTDLPYLQGTPILAKGTCISCIDDEQAQKQEEENNNYNGYGYNNYNYNNADYWAEQPDANDLCGLVTNVDGDGNVIVCDQSRYQTSGCAWIQQTLPSLDGRFKFDYAQQYANLKSQLARSKRLQWAMLGLVIVLMGAASMCLGYICASRRRQPSPERRAKLLQWRRDSSVPASSSNLA